MFLSNTVDIFLLFLPLVKAEQAIKTYVFLERIIKLFL